MRNGQTAARQAGVAGALTPFGYGGAHFTMSWNDGALHHEVSGQIPQDDIGNILLAIQEANQRQQAQIEEEMRAQYVARTEAEAARGA